MPAPVLPPQPANADGPSAPGGTSSFKVEDLIRQSMIEIGVLDPTEPLDGLEAETGLAKFNRMVDSMNSDEKYIYTENFAQYTLVPNVQPTLIGPSGTVGFVIPQRPAKILDAQIILNSNPANPVRQPLRLRDYDWWANKRAYTVGGSLPTDLYYQPSWPNGSMFLWVVPTINYLVELVTATLLSQVQLADFVNLPFGYFDMLVYELAISLAPSFQAVVSPTLMGLAAKAIQRVFGNNTASPLIGTSDSGLPSSGNPRPYFNYLTGLNR